MPVRMLGEKREPQHTINGNANQYNHSGKNMETFQKLNIELPHDLAVLLLGIWPRDTKTYIHTKFVHTCS